ncbi:hypothetical protein B0H13DRAFT_2358550 [Mycena leptocephala]|nr:hypothetical protein B0H13DRAFT_2358550 [Mycena leptocephala]
MELIAARGIRRVATLLPIFDGSDGLLMAGAFNQDILSKLQLLAAAAMTSGALVDVEMPGLDEEMPTAEGWEEQEEMEDADMLDDY